MEQSAVSRHTERRRARIDQLAEELALGAAIRLRCDSDDIRDVVDAVVAYLTEEYPSQDLYIPASLEPVRYPIDEMHADLRRGLSMRQICKAYRISRRKAFELLGSRVAAND